MNPLTQDQMDALLLETTSMHNGNARDHANDIFRTWAPAAAHTICELATVCPDPKLRFEAAKYVTERNLGKVSASSVDEDMPIEQLMRELTKSNPN
jgi:hypothetical protein